MRRLEIDLSEAQYQHIMEEIGNSNRAHLQEESFGDYSICLKVGIPNIFSILEMKIPSTIDLGEVEWRFTEVSDRS